MKVWRLNIYEGPGGLIVDHPSKLIEELECMEVDNDDNCFIFVENMDEDTFKNLREFDGF